MAKRRTKEDAAATKLATIVADLTLDLDAVGKSLALEPTVIANRLDIVLDATREEKERLHEYITRY